MARARRWFLGVIALAVSGAVVGVAPAAGAATANPSAPSLDRVWSVRVGPHGRVAMPVIYRGKAYTTDGSFVTAVGLVAGVVRWQVNHTDAVFGPLYLGLPSLVNGEIWAPWAFAKYGGIVAHDPRTGEFSMSNTDLVFGHIVSGHGRRALLYGGVVPDLAFLALQYGGENPGLIDVSSGSLALRSDPVIVDRRHVWVGYGTSMLRFDPGVGNCAKPPVDVPFCVPNQRVPLAGNIAGIAAGVDRTVVATTDTGVVQVFDGDTGAELWRATPGGQLATPAASDEVIAVGGSDGQVHAYDANGCGAAVCDAIWSGNAGAAIENAPAIADLVYVGTAVGTVVGFAPAGCGAATCQPTAIGRPKKPSAVTGGPVIGGGTIVVGTADGHLVGFRAP
jgi:outer membrane protein assembly factor BamB